VNAIMFASIPWCLLVAGGLAATVFRPNLAVSSATQHLAAGLVFAAAATEVLPDLQHQGSVSAILLGGALGLVAMFAVKAIGEKYSGPWAMVALIALDIFIDGIVIGIGFAVGARQGGILLLALGVEIGFLGLTAAEGLRGALGSRTRVIAVVAAGGALLPLGALLGGPVHHLPTFWLATAFAFALISLLYLVTEELLVEAHHKPDTPLITSMFFVGFLGLLALEQAIPAA
jgi:ZIP family zinc transporter